MKAYEIQEDANYFTIKSEKQLYQNWFREQFQDSPTISRKELKTQQKKMLLRIIQNELPDKQREYLILYFYHNMRVIDIARKFDVNKGTVSRELKQAVRTLRRFAKYISPELYDIVEAEPEIETHFVKGASKQNRRGRLG